MSTSQIWYVCIGGFVCLAAVFGFIESVFMYTCSVCKVSKFKRQMYQMKAVDTLDIDDQQFKCTCNKCAKAIDKKLRASLKVGDPHGNK
jgi:hypothetical protein